jgi:serine phosphatase RsbU (regulator of sigma subunit)
VYTSRAEDEERVREIVAGRQEGEESVSFEDWMVVSSRDPETGLELGIARPIRGSIEEMRRAAARNLGWGLSLTLMAMLAVLPLSRRLTSRLETVTRGADRIAKGDLTTRVPVSAPQEVGRLAEAFNHMAAELSQQRERLMRQEAERRDQELREQRLELEYRRKKEELEEARRFQLSLLPESLPVVPGLQLAVHTETATEVGGDYYDFRETEGALTVVMGDATGHGARAGTMVTVVKGLFAAVPTIDELAGFLARASDTIRRMGLERMRMAFLLARFEGDGVRFASGGMPPVLIRRVTGSVEEVSLPGMPLGGLPFPYEEHHETLGPGDVVLFMSDGLAEIEDLAGRPFGYERVKEILAESAATRPEEILAELVDAGRRWSGEGPPPDDVTLLVVRRG